MSAFVIPAAPDQKQAAALVKSLTTQSAGYIIKDEDGFVASWALIQRHDEVIARIGVMFDPFVEGLHKLHKMAIGLRNQFLLPVSESKDKLFNERRKYRTEQEAKARKEAEEQAEILRKAQAKELEKEARKLEKTGDFAAAQVVREEAKTMPAPVVPVAAAVPKQEGAILKKTWKFAVENPAIVPHEYFTLDEGKIRRVVNALGAQANIPGVRVWLETAEHSRAAR
jgi:hypothetical protein